MRYLLAALSMMGTLLVGCIEEAPLSVNSHPTSASAAVLVPPTITGYYTSGSVWTCPCGAYWQKYLQVPYDRYSPSATCPAIPFYVIGNNLTSITSVTINDPYYTVKIVSAIPGCLTLDIRALNNNWNTSSPAPLSCAILTFWYGPLSKIQQVISPGIIPVFFYNQQAYHQCTWYAGIEARNGVRKTPVTSFYDINKPIPPSIFLSGDPKSSGFPLQYSVLCVGRSHMAFLENITTSKVVTNADGSKTTTYLLTGSQYNVDCKGSRSSFSTSMVVTQRGTAPTLTYKIDSYPQVYGGNTPGTVTYVYH